MKTSYIYRLECPKCGRFPYRSHAKNLISAPCPRCHTQSPRVRAAASPLGRAEYARRSLNQAGLALARTQLVEAQRHYELAKLRTARALDLARQFADVAVHTRGTEEIEEAAHMMDEAEAARVCEMGAAYRLGKAAQTFVGFQRGTGGYSA